MGENAYGLNKVMEMTRWISIAVLLIHCYLFCYPLFVHWGLWSAISDRLLSTLADGLLCSPARSRLLALGTLLLALMGTEGNKSVHLKFSHAVRPLLGGLALYLGAPLALRAPFPASFSPMIYQEAYIACILTGYLLTMRGGAMATRLVKVSLGGDIFNKNNETFPQQEHLLETDTSLNFPTRYRLKGRFRKGWINMVNVFRGLLISGLPGSGKTLLVKQIIDQQIRKQFSMLIYDFKYPDLSVPAYNSYLRYEKRYPVAPRFFVLNFDEPFYRANPLSKALLRDIQDASEMARTILLGLNHDWIDKQGNFWVESPISFLTAVIWYLRKYQGGRYCTLPHVIELIHAPYHALFYLLKSEPEVAILVQPFISAFDHGASEQLAGQISGATISLGKLAAPNLYYVLSGDDFTMDIGNPEKPSIVCMASNPARAQVYGPVVSLYLTAFQQQAAKPGNRKTSLILEEFPTLFFNGIERFLAVCRSYLVAVTLVIQDASQLTLYYGKHQAEVILNLVGNVISGQVSGESARMLSERFGKIIQERNSVSVGDHPSMSVSGRLDYAVPAATIASLSAGEVAGIVADSPDKLIIRKLFHGKILHDFKAIRKNEARFRPLPVKKADSAVIMANYHRIKTEIRELIASEAARIADSPSIRKQGPQKAVGSPPDASSHG